MWVDNWSPDKVNDVTPVGARGVLCLRHSESLSAPRGWVMEDRRESIPRLFKPRDRGNLAAVPDASIEAKRPKREPTGSARRPRVAHLPRPQLFADLEPAVVVATVVAAEVVESVVVESVVVEVVNENLVESPEAGAAIETSIESTSSADDSTELLIRQDVDTRWAPHFDPDDDLGGMLDATGSMLRDAFRTRHNGRPEK